MGRIIIERRKKIILSWFVRMVESAQGNMCCGVTFLLLLLLEEGGEGEPSSGDILLC